MSTNLIHLDRERMKRRGDKKMTRTELVDEVVFLLDQGTHPLMVAQQLGYSWKAITKAADVLGRSGEIIRGDMDEWRRYSVKDRTGWGYAA